MEKPIVQFHELAWRLLEHEAGGQQGLAELANAAESVYQKMGGQIAILIGPLGFHALAARSLHMAKAGEPLLKGVEVEPLAPMGLNQRYISGQAVSCLKGLHESVRGREPAEVRRGLTALLANLIWLLSDLIGKDMALGLLRQGWPDMAFDARASDSEEIKE